MFVNNVQNLVTTISLTQINKLCVYIRNFGNYATHRSAERERRWKIGKQEEKENVEDYDYETRTVESVPVMMAE